MFCARRSEKCSIPAPTVAFVSRSTRTKPPMSRFTTGGNGSIRSAGTRADAPDMMNGNAVMYDVGRILAVGGAPGYDDSPATARAYTIDITSGPSAPVRTTRVGD